MMLPHSNFSLVAAYEILFNFLYKLIIKTFIYRLEESPPQNIQKAMQSLRTAKGDCQIMTTMQSIRNSMETFENH